uniref:(northern house mosquito) hypothetical protein n=1 Tax=Culex pipiens TaxID=7175 RepID=A0A8D8BP53_CULPI
MPFWLARIRLHLRNTIIMMAPMTADVSETTTSVNVQLNSLVLIAPSSDSVPLSCQAQLHKSHVVSPSGAIDSSKNGGRGGGGTNFPSQYPNESIVSMTCMSSSISGGGRSSSRFHAVGTAADATVSELPDGSRSPAGWDDWWWWWWCWTAAEAAMDPALSGLWLELLPLLLPLLPLPLLDDADRDRLRSSSAVGSLDSVNIVHPERGSWTGGRFKRIEMTTVWMKCPDGGWWRLAPRGTRYETFPAGPKGSPSCKCLPAPTSAAAATAAGSVHHSSSADSALWLSDRFRHDEIFCCFTTIGQRSLTLFLLQHPYQQLADLIFLVSFFLALQC